VDGARDCETGRKFQPVDTRSTYPKPMSQPARRDERKHSQDNEAEADNPESPCPSKQPQKLPSPYLKLSKQNLRKLNSEGMGSTNSSLPNGHKRSSSQRSLTPSLDATQSVATSQRSSGSTAIYRYDHLDAAEVYIHTEPPDDIRDAIRAIVKVEPSKKRRKELLAISRELHVQCAKLVGASVGEDEFVGLFKNALGAMNHSSLVCVTKPVGERSLSQWYRIQTSIWGS